MRMPRLLTLFVAGFTPPAYADTPLDGAGSAMLAVVALAGLLWYLLRSGRITPGRRKAGDEDLNRLNDLLSMTSDWRWATDTTHRYTHIGEGFRDLTGLDPSSLIGQRPWDIPWDGLGEAFWASYKRRLGRRDVVSVVLARHDANGQLRQFELLGKPYYDGPAFSGYHGIGRDVTERMKTERALIESQQRYHEVVESVKEVIFQTDNEGTLTFLNGAWRRISGYRVEKSLGRPLGEFLHPDDRPTIETDFKRVTAGVLGEFSCQLRLRTRKGEIRWIEAAVRPMPGSNGHHRGLAGTLDDISARKVAELTLRNVNQELEARVRLRTAELEASNRELEAFSYSVSHDLRAPLRAIDGFTRILEEDLGERLDTALAEHLDRIRRATQRMAHLIDALIELARLTRQPLHKEQVDLSELALQIVDELRSEEPDRDVEIEITRDIVVNADRVLARVLLENLLRNAWKFSSERTPARIQFAVDLKNDRRVFCIQDNGAGFDMAFASNLFRPFSRLHSNAEFSGTGIGLATVQRIIQRHGGTIWAEAEAGQGARFCFTFGT